MRLMRSRPPGERAATTRPEASPLASCRGRGGAAAQHQPVAGLEGGAHRLAAHLDAVEAAARQAQERGGEQRGGERRSESEGADRPALRAPGRRYACFVAQNISANSSTAARSARASSTLVPCLQAPPSFMMFQTFSCRSGNCSRCGGLK